MLTDKHVHCLRSTRCSLSRFVPAMPPSKVAQVDFDQGGDNYAWCSSNASLGRLFRKEAGAENMQLSNETIN